MQNEQDMKPEDWKNVEFFRPEEFACACCGKVHVKRELITRLCAMRKSTAQPIVITSGYRCPKHNAEVGGAKTSAHMSGYAADIQVSDSTRWIIALAASDAGFHRIGIAEKFIHVDCDPTKSTNKLWTY
jgi:uncharacterized protein YcbK (DUF882 family)